MNTYKVAYRYSTSDKVYNKTVYAPSESEAIRILGLMHIEIIISITIK